MASWKDFEAAEPEFAARVRGLFTSRKHHTIATLRADGSPRISGIECEFTGGELTFGSMPEARKGADLHRDPRFALHSATNDPPEGAPEQWRGEAKVAGRAVPAGAVGAAPDGEAPEGEAFRAELTEVVWTGLNPAADRLVIEFWREGRGVRRVERA